jgi:adenylate cyclase
VKAFLQSLSGSDRHELTDSSTIGRSSDAVVPVSDPRASRRHALIRRQADGFWYFDLGSSNGSFINERRVTTAQRLQPGDLVRVGDLAFRFEGSEESAGGDTGATAQPTLIGARTRQVIVLVCDLHEFTLLSERLPPDQLAPVIGSWYAEVVEVLGRHGATLDKFIGDCALAYWLDTSFNARRDALLAAGQLQQVSDQVQCRHEEALRRAGVRFRSGAALHLGPVAYGAISAGEITLLGDAVNLAFRMESLTREFARPVLVSREFLDGWEAGRRICPGCGSRHVKGRVEPVELHWVDFPPEGIPD